MTEEQQKFYDGIKSKFDPELMDNPAFSKAVEMYAKMSVEENDLQTFVDKNGISYITTNRAGEDVWKHYPQHQSLTRLRTQMTAVLRTLLKYAHKDVEQDADEDLIA